MLVCTKIAQQGGLAPRRQSRQIMVSEGLPVTNCTMPDTWGIQQWQTWEGTAAARSKLERKLLGPCLTNVHPSQPCKMVGCLPEAHLPTAAAPTWWPPNQFIGRAIAVVSCVWTPGTARGCFWCYISIPPPGAAIISHPHFIMACLWDCRNVNLTTPWL